MNINLKNFTLDDFDKHLELLFKYFDKITVETGSYGLLLFEQKVSDFIDEKHFSRRMIVMNKERRDVDFIQYSFHQDTKVLYIICNRELDINQSNIDEETGFPIDSFVLTFKKGESYE